MVIQFSSNSIPLRTSSFFSVGGLRTQNFTASFGTSKPNTLFILSNESLIRDNYDLFMQELLDYKLELLEVNNNFIDYNFNLDLNNLLTKYNFIRIEEFSNSNNKIETRSVIFIESRVIISIF